MNCEIEFLPVGEGSRAGDAIVVRSPQELKIMIDQKLISHLELYHGENYRPV